MHLGSLLMRVKYLETGNFTTIIFTWNATGFEMGNYTISTYAWSVSGEESADDNTYIDGTVEVTGIPWDVTGDGYVGIDDIIAVAEHF